MKVIIFFSIIVTVFQAQNVDSLRRIADAAPLDTFKARLYVHLSNICDLKDIADLAEAAVKVTDELLEKGPSPVSLKRLRNWRATALSNLGFFYSNQGNSKLALDYNHKALNEYEQNGDKKEASYVLNNIAYEYQSLGENEKALEYYNRSLQVQLKFGDKPGASTTIYNMGKLYYDNKDYQRAQEHYTKSLELSRLANYKRIIAQSYCSLSSLMLTRGDHEKAGEYAREAIKLTRNSGDLFIKLNGYVVFGQLLKSKQQYRLALRYLDSALTVGLEYRSRESLQRIEGEYYSVYSCMKDYKNSLEHYIKFNQYKDSILNDENRKASFKTQFKADYEKKEAILKEQQKRERVESESRHRFQQLIIYGAIAGLVLVTVFALFVFRSLQTNRRANKIITQQKELVELKNHIIEEKQKEIIDSITYARRIQQSLLPSEKYMEKNLTNLQDRTPGS